jgi:hypothetical protein
MIRNANLTTTQLGELLSCPRHTEATFRGNGQLIRPLMGQRRGNEGAAQKGRVDGGNKVRYDARLRHIAEPSSCKAGTHKFRMRVHGEKDKLNARKSCMDLMCGSIPLRPGMDMSRTIRSGRSRCASQTRVLPSLTVPTNSKSDRKTGVTRFRKVSRSSASSTRGRERSCISSADVPDAISDLSIVAIL